MNNISLYLMSLLYAAAGINHFVHPAVYRKIMPPWLPWPESLVLISGALEVLFAAMLIIPASRNAAAWCIIALLVAVFPANVQMMLNYLHDNHPKLWIAILRLPLQAVLIWWAYRFTR